MDKTQVNNCSEESYPHGSNTKIRTLPKMLRSMMSLLFVLVAPAFTVTVHAQPGAIGLNSVRVVGVATDKVTVEINFDNDGSRGKIYAHVVAKSKDGVLKSYENRPAYYLPIGTNVIAQSSATRPQLFDKQVTDVLQVELLEEGAAIPFMRKKFKSEVHWDAMAPSNSTSGQGTTALFKTESPRLAMYTTAFQENFQDDEFSEIDKLIEQLSKSRELSESGEWLLAQYLSDLNGQPLSLSALLTLAQINKWRLQNDKSVGLCIAEAMYFRERAWKIRGGRFNRNPSELALDLFRKELDKAEMILQRSKKFASDNPLWHQALLTVSSEQGKSGDVLKKIFDAGVKEFPNYRGLYSTMARHYAPIHGKADWAVVDSVVRLAVANTLTVEGLSNYAAVYQEVFDWQLTVFSPFEQSRVDWSSMKLGYMDLIKRHPYSLNRNNFAASACRANDAKAFSFALAQIGDELILGNWPTNYSPDLCKSRFLLKSPSA